MKVPGNIKFAKPLSLFSLLILFSLNAFGQSLSAIDSLKKVIETNPSDTAKVWALCELGYAVEASNPDDAFRYYKQAEHLSREINYPTGIVKSIFNITYVLDLKSQFSESKKYYEEAVEIAKANKLGMMEGSALFNYGNWYYKNKDLKTAMELYIEALEIFDRYPENPYSELIRVNMGNLYVGLRRYPEAIELSRQLIPELKKDEAKVFSLVQVMANLGDSFIGQRKWKAAIETYEELLQIALKNDIKEIACNAQNTLAGLYLKTEQFSKLFAAAKQTLKLSQEIEDQVSRSHAYSHLGNYYLHQQQVDSALYYFITAEELVREKELTNEQYLAETNLANAYLLQGNLPQYRRHKETADSLETLRMGLESIEAANEIEAKYELQKKENEILQKDLELSQTQNRNTLLATGLGALILLGGLAYYSIRKKQQNLLLEEQINSQNRERQRIAAELHDEIGGNLTSMMYMAVGLKNGNNIDQKAEKIIQTSADISGSMNEIIWSLTHDQSSMQDWLLFIRSRLSDMLENAGVNYSFEVQSDEEWIDLSAHEKRNLYLILKEAVNNAIRHSGADQISIAINSDEIVVKDNGSGFPSDYNSGNGLRNMKERAQKIGRNIEWVSNQGTEVRLT
ncbi:tetratricopeptide repeat protein [Jiulongibacter sediminis]|uniref:tetratricopeptide repeat protein n=1 Tax=Jiulongibacter sediminis TaxID=1605367 RepID=UPI0026EBF9DD|nr:tetratricopeptide repeat protein [Jiulongibacter sediminis]